MKVKKNLEKISLKTPKVPFLAIAIDLFFCLKKNHPKKSSGDILFSIIYLETKMMTRARTLPQLRLWK